MAATTDRVMRLQLPTDELILSKLQEGRNLGANIAEKIDRHQKTVTKRLNQLEDYGVVHNIGRGVYEITEKGQVVYEHINEYDEVDDFGALVECELRKRQE